MARRRLELEFSRRRAVKIFAFRMGYERWRVENDPKEVPDMIVIYRNGQPTVITGWRAWLVFAAAAVVMVVVGCLMLGAALTLFTLFLFGLPIAIGLAILASLVQGRRS